MAVLGAQAASTFESLRPHLMSVAYRLTGTVADVEDIVQEAWLRWDAAPGRDDVADLRAWLTTVVSRLGLDKLRSAARRRETYTGHWLPEPVVTGLGDARGGGAEPR
ncbi:RNA polymerase sigma factor SigJ, partial [Mycobacterium ulcerans]